MEQLWYALLSHAIRWISTQCTLPYISISYNWDTVTLLWNTLSMWSNPVMWSRDRHRSYYIVSMRANIKNLWLQIYKYIEWWSQKVFLMLEQRYWFYISCWVHLECNHCQSLLFFYSDSHLSYLPYYSLLPLLFSFFFIIEVPNTKHRPPGISRRHNISMTATLIC